MCLSCPCVVVDLVCVHHHRRQSKRGAGVRYRLELWFRSDDSKECKVRGGALVPRVRTSVCERALWRTDRHTVCTAPLVTASNHVQMIQLWPVFLRKTGGCGESGQMHRLCITTHNTYLTRHSCCPSTLPRQHHSHPTRRDAYLTPLSLPLLTSQGGCKRHRRGSGRGGAKLEPRLRQCRLQGHAVRQGDDGGVDHRRGTGTWGPAGNATARGTVQHGVQGKWRSKGIVTAV